MSFLKSQTSPLWIEAVLSDFTSFLLDHAAAEKKAAGMAISMISHYPDKKELVEVMANLAIEEMCHYREVIKHIHARNLQLKSDQKDEYICALHQFMRKGTEVYFLDRLLIAAIVEARGAERFAIIAKALPNGSLKKFYHHIAQSEEKHYLLFIRLATQYFSIQEIDHRIENLLIEEAKICQGLPIQAKLH